jgi:tetratricopeptide (TPR) repeat protein
MTLLCCKSKRVRSMTPQIRGRQASSLVASHVGPVVTRSSIVGLLSFALALLAIGLWPLSSLAQTRVEPAASASSEPRAEWTYYGLSKWHVDKREPERSIPTPEQRDGNPLEFGYFLMDVSDLAEAALARNDHKEAVVYFKTLIKAVPERAVSYRKACAAYQALGDWQNAITYCKGALTKEGAYVQDFAQLAMLVLQMKPTFTLEDAAELDAVAEHLRAEVPDDTRADEIACNIAVKLQDNKRLDACVNRLRATAPGSAKTLTFEWAYAMQRDDLKAAKRIIQEAKRKGVPPAVVQQLEQGMDTLQKSRRWHWLRNRSLQLGIGLSVAALAVLGAILAKRRRLQLVAR